MYTTVEVPQGTKYVNIGFEDSYGELEVICISFLYNTKWHGFEFTSCDEAIGGDFGPITKDVLKYEGEYFDKKLTIEVLYYDNNIGVHVAVK